MSKRLYPHNKVRYWLVYDIDDICALYAGYKLHKQTIRKWIKQGLKTIDSGKPALIYGNDLITFLKNQNASGKCATAFNQFFCMKCKDARHAYKNKVAMMSKDRMLKVQAKCRECKTNMFKNYKLDDYRALRKIFTKVDVSQLYDCETSPCKTHIPVHENTPLNESDYSQEEWTLF